MTESIELLTLDQDGHAIAGPRYPIGQRAVIYLNAESESIAYRHRFFRRDASGQPIPETMVSFLIPATLRDGPNPSEVALRAVAERMGWRS